MAAERDIATCVEPVVGLSIADLSSAIAAMEYVDRDEIPMRSRAEEGISARDRLLPCVQSARSLLDQARESH